MALKLRDENFPGASRSGDPFGCFQKQGENPPNGWFMMENPY